MKRTAIAALAVLATAVILDACTSRPLIKVDPKTESYVMEVFQQAGDLPVDILVVVDNSESMGDEQENLAEEFPALIRSLLDPPLGDDGKPLHYPVLDLHVGVISTDMGTAGYSVPTCADPIDGDDGILMHTPAPGMPGCASAYPDYLSYLEEAPEPSLVDRLATDFGCISVLGTSGCGFEQQLEASLKALTVHRDGANHGFLRDDSILTVLFVTDEEDCSVMPEHSEIFDTTRTDLGHLNLRCFYNPGWIYPVSRYVEGFRAIRGDDDKLVFGFIVGVPQDAACEGYGDGIAGCLDLPDMQERIDETRPARDRLVPSCSTDDGVAYPPRRLVQMAQQFGQNALVSSICRDTFEPAIAALTDRLHDVFDRLLTPRELEVAKDPADPCRCLATCSIIEELPDARPCADGRPCYEPDGPGTGCASSQDASGLLHTLCVIPQAGTRLADCSLDCTDPLGSHSPDGEGWYYLPYNDDGVPQLVFTESMIPTESSTTYLQCESLICPENRQCGPAGFEESKCCDAASFCDRDAPGGPTCMPRPR